MVLLCGPPGAGKSTAAMTSGLIVYDRDDPQWAGEAQFRKALAQIGRDRLAQAVVVRQGATSSARAKTAALIGATHMFVILGDPRELERRVARRGRVTARREIAAVKAWFNRFDRDDDIAVFPGWDAVRSVALESVSRDW